MAQTDWRPTEDVGNHDQCIPGAPVRTARILLHTKGLKESIELAQDRRAWSAFVRDVVKSIGDAGSTRPGRANADTGTSN